MSVPEENALSETVADARALNLVVMLGGPSAEREVSLKSGASVAAALRSLGHFVTEIDPEDGSFALPDGADAVFLALHGRYGEDGTVQRELESLGTPYTGCGPEASATAFDKACTKALWEERGIPTPRGATVDGSTTTLPEGFSFPVILKPVRQGSSVGLRIVESEADFKPALEEALEFGDSILMEELIRGREFTVGILDGKTLPLVEIRPRSGTFDYENKYTEGATEYFCPAELESDRLDWMNEVALEAFDAVGGRDYGRLDVMLREDGAPFFLEVNTLPGMTETSLLPKAAKAAGFDYPQLCQKMIDLALRRA